MAHPVSQNSPNRVDARADVARSVTWSPAAEHHALDSGLDFGHETVESTVKSIHFVETIEYLIEPTFNNVQTPGNVNVRAGNGLAEFRRCPPLKYGEQVTRMPVEGDRHVFERADTVLPALLVFPELSDGGLREA